MQEILYVSTGEIRSGGSGIVLNSGAIGSCVVITAFDPIKKIGAMAHVMLPGTSPTDNILNSRKYASDAIEELLNLLKYSREGKSYIEICLVGGGNVLKRKNDSIGKNNIDSIEELLKTAGIDVCSREVGGFKRRTALFDIEKGCIYFTVGDSKPAILWQSKGCE